MIIGLVKGATLRITHLEKIGKLFQVCHSKSVLISLSRNHPCLVFVYYYSFGVFLRYYFEVPFNKKIILSDQKNE